MGCDAQSDHVDARWCESEGLSDWRQYRHNLCQLKRLMRIAQGKKCRKAKAGVQQSNAQMIQAYQAYIDQAQRHLDKIQMTLTQLTAMASTELWQQIEIEGYIQHAKRQIDQIERRVIKGEIIPHEEKVFSIFEPHTEWINKGKAVYRLSWVSKYASWKTSINSSCIIM